MPLPITFEFMPYAIQVVLPLLLEHETLLLAAVALGPLATLTLVTSETGELMVHCTAATCAPPDVLREIFKVVLPPGEAVPELMETVACWASAVLAAAHRTKIARSAGRSAAETWREWCVFMMPLVMSKRPRCAGRI